MICADCVTSETLKRLVRAGGAPGTCGYCNKDAAVITSRALFDYIYAHVRKNVAFESADFSVTAFPAALVYPPRMKSGRFSPCRSMYPYA